MPLSDSDTQQRIRFLQPIRNMNWLIYLIWGGFTLSGIRTFWDWGRLLAGQRSNIDLPTTYGAPIDGAFGLLFCLLAALLLWFTFKTAELRQFWVMSVALSLILISWGCERCLSVFFALTAVEVALVILPLYGTGALLASGWLFWFHRVKPTIGSPPKNAADPI